MKRNDNDNIKEIFEEHGSRLCKWPPSWGDIEAVIKDAYWKGVQSGSLGDDDESW